jgi:hypothetical protein
MLTTLLVGLLMAPDILTREQWGAKPVLAGARFHEIQFITIHHTGVVQNPMRTLEDKLKGLQAFSQRVDKLADGRTKPAWPDIPYHYYISVDGRIGEGRPWNLVGDTNTAYDPAGHLLVVVEGEFDREVPSEAQLKSLDRIVLWAAQHWSVPARRIRTHQDYARTDCPGKALQSRMSDLRNLVRIADFSTIDE